MARRTSRSVENDTIPIDTEVDKTFGEPVIFRPMKASEGGYREAVPDPARQVVIARGIFDMTRGAVEQTGGGAMHRQATVDTTLSIREEPIQQCDLRKGDRVFFPERNETHEVLWIHPEPGGRPDVHMVRVLEEEG